MWTDFTGGFDFGYWFIGLLNQPVINIFDHIAGGDNT